MVDFVDPDKISKLTRQYVSAKTIKYLVTGISQRQSQTSTLLESSWNTSHGQLEHISYLFDAELSNSLVAGWRNSIVHNDRYLV